MTVDLRPPSPRRKLARNLGLVGLLFFLVKGLLWLSVPLLLAMKGCQP